MKIKRSHWHHFFGGIALLLLITQLISGLVLTMFYLPHLNEAYASIQNIYNELSAVAWVRDSHRWAALFLFVTVIIHFIRSLLRKDYLNRENKTFWLAGVLLFLPMLGFLLTGFILPWEWRGYWFMEMAPNYVEGIAFIGPALKQFLIDAFTLNRAFVAHVVILPAITLILLDIHFLARIKKRTGGISLYIVEHSLLTVPFLLAIAVLAYMLPMPTQDPQIIPMPLEGAYIPSAEWFILIFYMPYMHFKESVAPLFSFYIPFVIFLVLAIFPYYLKEKKGKGKAQKKTPAVEGSSAFKNAMASIRRVPFVATITKTLGFLSVFLVAISFFGPLYAVSYQSPTMGCNSCHHILSGKRMGIPPETFKDRVKNPKLEDNQWMMEHWFYPTVIW